mmetsp:Transcript_95384/g.132508  ORF Transcript_95384/g.132508 Transcript_95384/m.132508 type:complete len:123 (+) Transcript_95384:20-388(+)
MSEAATQNRGSSKAVRLYVKGTVLGFRRGKHMQRPDTSRIRIEGVKTADATEFYLGKRVAYVYKARDAQRTKRGRNTRVRVIWGKVVASHGNSGVVRVRFQTNLPPRSFGASVRVMMYPSRI